MKVLELLNFTILYMPNEKILNICKELSEKIECIVVQNVSRSNEIIKKVENYENTIGPKLIIAKLKDYSLDVNINSFKNLS